MISVTTRQLNAAVRMIIQAAREDGFMDQTAYDELKHAFPYTSHASIVEEIVSSIRDDKSPCHSRAWSRGSLEQALHGVDTLLQAALYSECMSRADYAAAQMQISHAPEKIVERALTGLHRILMDSDAVFAV